MSEFDKSIVQAMFSSKRAQKNIDTYFPLIEAAYADQTKGVKGLTDEDHRALKLYMYATIRAETGNFSPRNEGISQYNSYTFPEIEPVYDGHHHLVKINTHQKIVSSTLLGKPFQKYEGRMGNAQYGDGQKFKGRGFVQLTGQENYKTYSREVRGLEANPELAEKPENAAKLIVAYVLKNKAAILNSLSHGNLTEARIVVNGKPKKGKLPNGLHEFSTAYEAGKKVATPAPSAPKEASAAGSARTAQAPLTQRKP